MGGSIFFYHGIGHYDHTRDFFKSDLTAILGKELPLVEGEANKKQKKSDEYSVLS